MASSASRTTLPPVFRQDRKQPTRRGVDLMEAHKASVAAAKEKTPSAGATKRPAAKKPAAKRAAAAKKAAPRKKASGE